MSPGPFGRKTPRAGSKPTEAPSKPDTDHRDGVLDTPHYAAVLNFFYFLLLDEGLALSAAYKAVRTVQKILRKNPSTSPETAVIHSMSQVLRKYKNRKRHHAVQPPHSQWHCPNSDFLGAWKEYMRHSDLVSSETLVLHFILKYPVDTISSALDVPEGTVYFRLGRGLEAFAKGSFFQTGAKK